MVARDAIDHAVALLQKASAEDGHVAVVYHADADGIASAALLCNALGRVGARATTLTPAKGSDVYDPCFRERLERMRPACSVIVDTGSRADAELAPSPSIVIDHHPTAKPPAADCFVHDDAAPASAWLSYAVASQLAAVEDRAWLVAVGLLGDLGERARSHEFVRAASRSYGARTLQEVVSSINASGRVGAPEPEIALTALRDASDPRQVLAESSREGQALRAMRREVQEATTRARRVPPRVVGRWAIIELSDPCRIHGVIASAWTRRLRDRIVLVANRGYVAGRVHVSVRSREEVDLRAALRELMPAMGPEFAAGHARASGAIVSLDDYERLRAAIDEAQRSARGAPPMPAEAAS